MHNLHKLEALVILEIRFKVPLVLFIIFFRMLPISVVVICKNEEAHLGKCLESLLEMEYPQESFEIIVVDQNSMDRTVEIIEQYQKEYPLIHLIHNGCENIAKSRNMGVAAAQNMYIAFTDADCEVPKEWLQILENAWLKRSEVSENIVGVGGGNILSDQYSPMRRALATILQTYLGSRGSLTGMRSPHMRLVDHIPTVNVMFEKSLLLKHPFHEAFDKHGEDQALSWKLTEEGYHLLYVPESVVFHYGPDSLMEWMGSMFKYGYYRIALFSYMPKKINFISILPLLFVLCISIGILTSIVYPNIWVLLLLLFFLYGSCLLFYSLFQRTKPFVSYKEILYMVFLYVLTHISYGIGMLFGCFVYIKKMAGR